MPRKSANSDCFFKFDLTEAEKEQFRWACKYFSEKHEVRWSMSKTLRSLMENFVVDMIADASGEKEDGSA